MTRYCEFLVAAEALTDEVDAYLDDEESARPGLRAAYESAIQTWARAELFQFGPAASSSKDMSQGRGLRDLIYSWPFVSRCRVEEQVLGRAYETAGFENLVQVPINARGLFAVEYLAFFEGSDNACTQFSIVNAGDAWASIASSELTALKSNYLGAVVMDVQERAAELFEAWDEDGGNFLDRLTRAESYMDQQHALNIVAHSLLYMEVEVKDYKLGAPAGLYADAPLERPENSFSRGATALIAQNLRGFEDLFAGCNGQGLGFDDWLTAAGHPDLAEDILAALASAKTAVAEFPALSSADPAELAQLHAEVKRLTDLLKNDLFGQGSPLGLVLPTSVEGDTD